MALKAHSDDMASEVHISEADAVSDFKRVLAYIRAGTKVIIDSEGSSSPVALVFPAILYSVVVPPHRTISEAIALARKHEAETGKSPVIMDADFAADVEDIIRNRKPWNPPAWE
jgi:hypothetical protein